MNDNDFKVAFDKILQPKVKTLLQKEQLNTASDFDHLKPTCYTSNNGTKYYKHFKTYHVKKDIQIVWQIYTTISPVHTWLGPMVTFGCQYHRNTKKISYIEDHFDTLEAGQILFLNLRLPLGLLQIAVCHEIMEVNESNKLIKICYLEKGASEGTQLIQFFSTPEGYTHIEHTTYYRSQSVFRDKILYPTLHTKAITEFHNHIRAKIESL